MKIILRYQTWVKLLIILINQVNHNFLHNILFFRTAFGYHQCQGNEGIVCYTLSAICGIQDAVLLHEPEKKHGCDTFVAIAEGVIFHYEIEQQAAFSSTDE